MGHTPQSGLAEVSGAAWYDRQNQSRTKPSADPSDIASPIAPICPFAVSPPHSSSHESAIDQWRSWYREALLILKTASSAQHAVRITTQPRANRANEEWNFTG